MKTVSSCVCALLSTYITAVVLSPCLAANDWNQAWLGQSAVISGCGYGASCHEGPTDYSHGEGCGCGSADNGYAVSGCGNCSLKQCLKQKLYRCSPLHGKVCMVGMKLRPKHWLHTPIDTGAGSRFNCCCKGSYKFPVPPLSTYHWPGRFANRLMTDYQSPWRFPGVQPFGTEYGSDSYDFVPPSEAEPITSLDHDPVSYSEDVSEVADDEELTNDVRRMSQIMANFYRK